MGNVACVSVSGACVFACHVCSCFQRHVSARVHTRPSFLCILSPRLLPICIFGEKTNAKMDTERKSKQAFRGIVHCCTCQPPGDPNPLKFTQTNTHDPDLCLAAVFGFVDLYRVPILEPPIKSWHFLFVIIILLSLDNCILKGHLMLYNLSVVIYHPVFPVIVNGRV